MFEDADMSVTSVTSQIYSRLFSFKSLTRERDAALYELMNLMRQKQSGEHAALRSESAEKRFRRM